MFERITLALWLSEWFEIYKKPTLSKSSIENIERTVRLHIDYDLKSKYLDELTVFDIDRSLSRISSTRMRKYAYYVLNNSLSKAYRLGLMSSDVMRNVEKVVHRVRSGNSLSVSEQLSFLQALKSHRMNNLFMFYLYTGVRRCEALSLLWSDVDFERKQIFINGTKTNSSRRTLVMLPEVAALLRDQRERTDGERVFPYSSSYVSRQFRLLCGSHKLHDLRHTFLTRCAESGINVNVAQQLAGHSDIKTTLKIYTHVSADFIRHEYGKFSLNPFDKKR